MKQAALGKDKQLPLGPGLTEYIIIVALFAIGITGVFVALFGTVHNYQADTLMHVSATPTTTQRDNTASRAGAMLNQDKGLMRYSEISERR